MYQFTLTIIFDSKNKKEMFKEKVKGARAFDITKIYKSEYEDNYLTTPYYVNKITRQSDLSITYLFELWYPITIQFFKNLTKRFPKNKFLLIVRKHQCDQWSGGFLKNEIRFGNWDDLITATKPSLSFEDKTNKTYRRLITRIVKKFIKKNYKDIRLEFELYEMLKNYKEYESKVEDKYMNTYFYNIYKKIEDQDFKRTFHKKYSVTLRKNKIYNALK